MVTRVEEFDPLPLENLEQAALLEQLLPLRSLAVHLQFIDESHPRFFHQAAVSALLRHLLPSADDYSHYLILDAPETARINYQAGASYCFSIVCLAGGESLLATLMLALRQLPYSAPTGNPLASFGANLRWRGFSCNFCDHPVDQVEDLGCYGIEHLAQEAALWAEHHTLFHWQWLTPVRLLKEKSARSTAKGEARYCADAGDLSAALLLARLYDTVNALLTERGDRPLPPRQAAPHMNVEAQHCFWLDAGYQNSSGKEQVMGGLLGEFTYSTPVPLPPPWAHFLVLGQYIGLGQRRSFGWGRYQLVTTENQVSCRRQLAAQPLLERALEPANLRLALQHKTQKTKAKREPLYKWQRDAQECDLSQYECNEETDAEGDQAELPPTLLKRANALAQGRYDVPPLRGVIIPKTDGEWRALAVAPFFDAVLQRAVAQILAPSLDRVMDNRSYGYRRGRSRLDAKEQIQLAYRNGARWVLEADIEDFFDSVAFSLVAQRLRALFHQDPINEAILAWLSAPVDYDGLRLQRKAGLPQGSPLSPVLANLLLDDFDSDMRKAGFNCLRFADDFVVVCQSREEAERAWQRAASSLNEHGLFLAENKTRVISFERGFRFLGYLFVNELALDVGSKALKQHDKLSSPGHAKPQCASGWLADFLAQRPQALLPPNAPHSEQRVVEKTTAMVHSQAVALGNRENDGTFLCVSGAPALISTDHGRVLVQRDDETVMSVPWQGLRSVLLLGRHHLTHPAMIAALSQGVAIHFASRGGQYQGLLDGNQPRLGPRLWLLQEERVADAAACVAVARELTNARIRHQREVLRQRALSGWHTLGDSLSQVDACTDLSALQGIEGAAARTYFAALAQAVHPQWGFHGRNRRPPRAPFNALLSLGFTLLYAHTETLLIIDGLNPRAGFYHKPHGSHSTLASDMMEPFRHLVERCALSFLSSGKVKPADFSVKDNGACELSNAARRLYLERLSERFETSMKGRDGSEGKLIQLLRWQNRSLIELIRAKGPFTAWLQR
ncbi:CRISPR-associated endonuclease Cas1 [Teredinibacter turnerae]|uniref:CRISPR-associated endonuclease Cas1 n=1 Tax=Teredinibacter turnerae TaxID=2426 RepID=UPI00036056D4|nr:CRISPR-associated endonuclease Cas1 [Teredinibacter turnerae]